MTRYSTPAPFRQVRKSRKSSLRCGGSIRVLAGEFELAQALQGRQGTPPGPIGSFRLGVGTKPAHNRFYHSRHWANRIHLDKPVQRVASTGSEAVSSSHNTRAAQS